jgi:hypothetical protein
MEDVKVTERVEPPRPSRPERYEIGQYPELYTTTLGELRETLPLGIIDERTGVRYRDFECRELFARDEFEISDVAEERKLVSQPEVATEILCRGLKRIGPHVLEDMKEDARRAFVLNLSHADAIYAYVVLRRRNIGPELILPISCPMCTKKYEPRYNLDHLEVLTLEGRRDEEGREVEGIPKQLIWCTPLREPKALKRGDRVIHATGIWFRMAPWHVVQGLPGIPTISKRRREFIKLAFFDTEPSCSQIGESPILTDAEVDSLGLLDLGNLEASVDENTPGIRMSVESTCPDPRCKHFFRASINWSYDGFFRPSRPSLRRKRR